MILHFFIVFKVYIQNMFFKESIIISKPSEIKSPGNIVKLPRPRRTAYC